MLYYPPSHSQQLTRTSSFTTCHCQHWRALALAGGHHRSFPSSPERQRSRAMSSNPHHRRSSVSSAVFGVPSIGRNSRASHLSIGSGRSTRTVSSTPSSSSNYSNGNRLLAPATPRISSLVPFFARRSSSSTVFSPAPPTINNAAAAAGSAGKVTANSGRLSWAGKRRL